MSEDQFLKGKKILLTSFSYAMFGGAELNPVELAEQLVKFGATVRFFSYDYSGPLAHHMKIKFNTEIYTDDVHHLTATDDQLQVTEFDINEFDYIWVGGNTLPISIIRQINTAKKLPKFLFIHMSTFVGLPLDAPLLPTFEKSIASKILTISDDTTNNCIYRILGKDIPLDRWDNPTPAGFSVLKPRSGDLKRIAVISSSHPTDEVIGIISMLQKQGIIVDLIGRFNNNMQIVDAEFYNKYDAIIGIGKNVKYSLVSGIPVYIYGRFGGPGYLSEKNIQTAEKNNFSGRGFSSKTTRQITQEIIEGYSGALAFHEARRQESINAYSIDVVAKRLFTELEKEQPKKITFPEEHINWLVSMQINILQRTRYAMAIRDMEARIQQLESQKKSERSLLLRTVGRLHGR